MNSGVLLLSHCGLSFIEQLIAAVRARGLEAYVLSSQPILEQQGRISMLARDADWFAAADKGHSLGMADVDHALDTLALAGRDVRGCLCVWEGYREFVARANRRVGAADLAPELVEMLRDKLALRAALGNAGLTSVTATRLTRQRLDALRDTLHRSDKKRYFIKPVRGVASYGAFPLRTETTWEQLEAIADEAASDQVYRAVFGDRAEFLAEEYIEGREFSFEIIACGDRRFVVAIHEKLELTERETTVLEDCCISPPLHLTSEERAAAIAWIDRVCAALGLDHGCYHLEARFDGARWEVIEINPRIGGSMISASVAALTGTAGLLDLWLETLLTRDAEPLAMLDAHLEKIAIGEHGEIAGVDGTLFRVFYAEPGTIAKVAQAPLRHPPAVTQIFLHTGDEIAQSSREVFVAQCLWTYELATRDHLLPTLLDEAPRAITVAYATPFGSI